MTDVLTFDSEQETVATTASGNYGVITFDGDTTVSAVGTSNREILTIESGPPGPTGPPGADGAAGAPGTPGSKWWPGTGGPPASGTGAVGDYGLVTSGAGVGDVYLKTTSTVWTLQGNIRGATGATGSTGSTGSPGTPGSVWFNQTTDPTGSVPAAAIVGDYCLNTTSGDVFKKTGASAWTLQGNIKGPAGAGGGSALTVRDEGTSLNTAVADIDFVGAGVTATYSSPKVTVTIPGGGGGGTTQAVSSYVGSQNPGASFVTMVSNRVYLKKITLTAPGVLSGIECYIDTGGVTGNVDSYTFALHEDSAGTVGKIIGVAMSRGDSVYAFNGTRWIGAAIGKTLAAGDYWISVGALGEGANVASRIAYDATGPDRYYDSGGSYLSDGYNGASGYVNNAANVTYSLRATVIASGTGGVGTTRLLGLTNYNPGTQATYTTTSTTMVDVDATNLAVSFTAPPSGSVRVTLTGSYCVPDNTGGYKSISWGVREGSTALTSRFLRGGDSETGSPDLATSTTFVITGLVPGSTHTYKWGHFVSGGTGKLYAGGTVTGAAIMEVEDAAIGTGAQVVTTGSGILGSVSYLPASDASLNATTTIADVDATNIAVTFVAPSGGSVLVRASAPFSVDNQCGLQLAVRSGTTTVGTPMRIAYYVGINGTQNTGLAEWKISGLTPGQTYTYKLAAVKFGVGTGACQVLYGPSWGPANLTIFDATAATSTGTLGSNAVVYRKDLGGTNWTNTTPNTWNTIPGLSFTFTAPADGVLELNSRAMVKCSAASHLDVRASISPAPGANGSNSPVTLIHENVGADTYVSFPLNANWAVSAGVTYTVTVEELHTAAGTLTVNGAVIYTELAGTFAPSQVSTAVAQVTGLLGYATQTATQAYSTSTSTDTDIDTSNLAVTFTVPASGKVRVVLASMVYWSQATGAGTFLIRESGTTIAAKNVVAGGQEAVNSPAEFIITGLTPGAVKTWTWGWRREGSTGTLSIYSGGSTGTFGNPIMSVYDAGTSGGVGTTTPVVKTKTSGSTTISSTTFAAVDSSLDITLAANVGDTVTVGVDYLVSDGTTATYLFIDVGTVVGGTVVNKWGGTEGMAGGVTLASTRAPVSITAPKVLTAADISNGTVTLRLLARVDTGSRIIKGDGTQPLIFWAKNESANVKAIAGGDTSWHLVGGTGEPAFQNSWVNYGGSEPVAAFSKDGQGRVQVRGTIKSGTVGAGAFILPVGYRPTATMHFPALTNNGTSTVLGEVAVGTDGTVGVYSPSANTYVRLDSITFPTI